MTFWGAIPAKQGRYSGNDTEGVKLDLTILMPVEQIVFLAVLAQETHEEFMDTPREYHAGTSDRAFFSLRSQLNGAHPEVGMIEHQAHTHGNFNVINAIVRMMHLNI